MAKIEGIRVKNFRSLKDVTLGKLWNQQQTEPLTPMTVVIGKNGVGKSTLFDVFGFLSDALKFGIEDACEMRGRGGFERICSQGQAGSVEFEISYLSNEITSPLTYELKISNDGKGRPFVKKELLFTISNNKPVLFLALLHGLGFSINNDVNHLDTSLGGFDFNQVTTAIDEALELALNGEGHKSILDELNEVAKYKPVIGADAIELSDNRKLGIATLGALKEHEEISAFRAFIEGWYLSYFTPDAARTLPLSGAQQHLNSKGDNLANVVQFMEREHRDSFQSILDRIAEKIPGIHKIKTEKTSDGRLLLCFNDQGFQDPFYAPQMSDGTLKVFAYLLLLEDPNPPPFICIEEPENGLYHKLLETLASEFRAHATGREGGSQLFITTHQPYFVDALDPEEVWILEKGEDGFSTITRASEIPYVQKMVDEGLPLGGLWYSDYLDAR